MVSALRSTTGYACTLALASLKTTVTEPVLFQSWFSVSVTVTVNLNMTGLNACGRIYRRNVAVAYTAVRQEDPETRQQWRCKQCGGQGGRSPGDLRVEGPRVPGN